MNAAPTSHRRARVRRKALAIPILGAALLAAGCVGATRANPFSERRGREVTVLEVDNRHWADMTISVRRGSSVVRLGLVTSNSGARFNIPPEAAAAGMSVTFLADPVGSDAVYESPIVTLAEGDMYVWTLAVNLQHSTLVRR